ncbi:hypothetical protein O7627_09140 [Solwaraspora sp. WMMD1047]|uniref:hypothetical protein n=1 Tax=Solwaraspora sp. WMMD1047 TaxID=3016102 RepID=UPI0024172397|nr:hypothetical protein [Solwaraspora sp. WMMD1047]MDG4829465.1 hypothetical protein [Solwaraspora sp. WMMD1047]
MRRVVVVAAAGLLLAGCSTPADPGAGESTPPSPVESTTRGGEADLGAVCEALEAVVKLPADGTVQYKAKFNKPTGWATNVPLCDIEPEGEYYDVATKVPTFGRAEFNYGVLTKEELQRLGYPQYSPERAQDLLTLDQADPLGDEVPCANKPCKNSINGYQYNFRFEATMDDIGVFAKFDYITTDVSGDQLAQYRNQAIAAYTASMDTIAAGL